MNERQLILSFGTEDREFPLSLENARILLLRAVMIGNILITSHFRQRGEERGFTTVDVERVLRDGEVVSLPRYSSEFNNWVFCLAGKCETRKFEARVALDWTEDLELPTVVYITGICKGDSYGRNKGKQTGRRESKEMLRLRRRDARD
jgi:hypothetical protein